VHAVNRLWEAKAGGGTRRLLTGALGSELGVREGVLGKRVLHFATHGFVLDPLCGADEVGRLDPLLLSGLILSGGNRSDPESDGILTAAEVTTLDLSGVELAVLSACDTGGGEIVDGEGVLGLRRAFWQAGVRSLVVSLWPVGDRVAQEWMGGFYEAYLEGGSPSGAALAASRGMLDRRREQRLSTHPIYWAGFVTTGTGWN
jgi:CHAT domain-containing protein